MPTYYEVLGISQKASTQEIKNAYRNTIKQYHPDKNPNKAEANHHTQIINEAYSVLKESIKRQEYDNLLSLKNNSETTEQHTSKTETDAREIPHYCCEKCSRQDSTL